MNKNRYNENFDDLSISELKTLFNEVKNAFNFNLNKDCYTNELYNDDGEYNLIKWLRGMKNE